MNRSLPLLILSMLATMMSIGCTAPDTTSWYKGNLHTHSFWSDGDDFPEAITQWYVDNGYGFLAISDHNTIADGERWLSIPMSHSRYATFQRYLQDSPEGWVEWKQEDDTVRVRLKTYEEYSARFQDPGSFLMKLGEEVSDGFDGKPIHINATNIAEYIEPRHGESVVEVMQNNVNAILEQGERLQRAVMPHINHPNFIWAIRADELALVDGERFFEVYNGHPAVNVMGDPLRHGTERMWDVVNTIRLRDGRPLMLGIGTDDAHNYQELAPDRANVGRGWVMVRANELTPDAILTAMDAGEFYASSGVTMAEVSLADGAYTVAVEPEEGVNYTIEFFGTDRDHDPAPVAVYHPETDELVTYRYSDEVGRLLQQTTGTEAVYAMTGNELFVRARVTSDKPVANPVEPDEVEMAWMQPVQPPR